MHDQSLDWLAIVGLVFSILNLMVGISARRRRRKQSYGVRHLRLGRWLEYTSLKHTDDSQS